MRRGAWCAGMAMVVELRLPSVVMFFWGSPGPAKSKRYARNLPPCVALGAESFGMKGRGGLLGVPRYGVFERTSCLRHKKKTVTGSRVGKKASTTLYRPAGKPSKHYIGDVWQCSDQQQSVDPAKS